MSENTSEFESVNKDGEIVTYRNAEGTRITDDALAQIKGSDDVVELFDTIGAELEDFDDYGSGFSVLETNRKSILEGEPFIILGWRFVNGDNGVFVTAHIITASGGRYIINDGSTGIRDQLRRVTERRIAKKHPEPQKALKIKNGLKRSDYTYTDQNGDDKKAVTYYLA